MICQRPYLENIRVPVLKLMILKLTLLILLTLFAPRGGVKIFNLLLQMSYNLPKMLSSELQSHGIKIEDICHDGVSEGKSGS